MLHSNSNPPTWNSRGLKLALVALSGIATLSAALALVGPGAPATAQQSIYNIAGCGPEPKNQLVTNKDGCTCKNWGYSRCCEKFGKDEKTTVNPKTGKKTTTLVDVCLRDGFRHVCREWYRPPCRAP